MSFRTLMNRYHKVLIVEDDNVLRGSLVEKFTDRGFKTLEASAAQEVLALVGSEKPSAIVLDLILPVEDGITLLEELRNAECKVPVVILSNLLGSDDLRADAARLGAEFFNKSSTTLDEVVEVVGNKL